MCTAAPIIVALAVHVYDFDMCLEIFVASIHMFSRSRELIILWCFHCPFDVFWGFFPRLVNNSMKTILSYHIIIHSSAEEPYW